MPAATRPEEVVRQASTPRVDRRARPARGAPYFIREGVEGFKRNGLMSVAAVTITMVTLTALGAAFIVASTLDLLAAGVERKLEVIVYLREGLRQSDVGAVRTRLIRLPGVTEVAFVSKEDALASFQQRLGGKVDLKEFLSHNPLPESFAVTADRPERLEAIAAAAGRLPQVEHASYGGPTIDRLTAVTRIVRFAGLAASAGLALVAMIIIVNTIRLTVFARRMEIEVMRLVGATAWFIRWPFVIEGAITGAVAACAALLLITGTYAWLAWTMGGSLPFLPLLSPLEVARDLAWKLMVWGVLIGIGGSLLAVRRFLSL
jgi:cell division transport system permease protein